MAQRADADPFGYLERGGPASRPSAGLSASGLAKKAGLDPTTFNKSKRITPEGAPALALDRIDRQVAAGDRRHGGHVRVADHRPRRRLDASDPADRPRRGGHRRLFRRRGLSGRQGLGRNLVSGGQRRARLRAGNLRQLDGAGLSRRHCGGGLAGAADAARRPRRGQDERRRGDGEGAEAPHREVDRTALAQSTARGAHARRSTKSLWMARIMWASQYSVIHPRKRGEAPGDQSRITVPPPATSGPAPDRPR